MSKRKIKKIIEFKVIGKHPLVTVIREIAKHIKNPGLFVFLMNDFHATLAEQEHSYVIYKDKPFNLDDLKDAAMHATLAEFLFEPLGNFDKEIFIKYRNGSKLTPDETNEYVKLVTITARLGKRAKEFMLIDTDTAWLFIDDDGIEEFVYSLSTEIAFTAIDLIDLET